MSLSAALVRVDELHALLGARPATPAVAPAAAPASSATSAFAGQLATATSATAAPTSYAGVLGSSAIAPGALAGAGGPAGPGAAALAAAQGQVGVTEQPPGSNDGPQIATYRQATAGAGVGPWCAYFVSWAAAQAGTPIGEQGQGLGSVAAVADWGRRTGRELPAGSVPQPGDLIVWGGRHIGMVESVGTDGSIHTVEGNSSDAVSRRTYGADGGGATSYVRLG